MMANTADDKGGRRWFHGIGSRIGIGYGVLLLAAVLAFGAAVRVGTTGQADAERALREMADRVAGVQAMQIAQLEAVSSVRNAALMSNARAVKLEMQVYQAAIRRLQALEFDFAARPLDETSRALLARSIALRKSAEPIVAEAIDQVLALAGEEGARMLSVRLTPVQQQWMEQLRLLAAHEKEVSVAELAAIDSRNVRRMSMLVAALLVIVSGAGAAAVWFGRSVTRRLRRAVEVSERVADGDLSLHIEVDGVDETAALLRTLRAMVAQLSEMVAAVRASAENVVGSSRDIDSRNQDLAIRTERQAAALQQTSAALQELASAVGESTLHVESARALAEQAALAAGVAGGAADMVISTMSRISDSSRRIADIIGVIDAIAFRTNILALNAAVEAARAGEEGRGFAVVAGEVRALSQQVTEAAGEVRGLIAESVNRVQDGSRQVAEMGTTMGRLVSSTERVKDLLDAISGTANAQRSSIGELNAAMRDVDSATQQNAALVEHVAAAARGLVVDTESLNAFVDRFRVQDQSPSPDASPAGDRLTR